LLRLVALAPALLAACGSPPPPAAALPPNSFAVGVFGDGPYRIWEEGRFKRLIEDVNRTELSWLFHVGDILSYPCSVAEQAPTANNRSQVVSTLLAAWLLALAFDFMPHGGLLARLSGAVIGSSLAGKPLKSII
jgi:hypothetical protein